MGEVRITLLGYVCINPDDKEDIKVFKSLEELITKKNNVELSRTNLRNTPVDPQHLPIIDEALLNTKEITFPLSDETSGNDWKKVKMKPNHIESPCETGFIPWKSNVVEIFRETFPNSRLTADFQQKYSVPVSTHRSVVKKILNRLAHASGNSSVARHPNPNRYYSDFVLVKNKKSESLVMYNDTDKLHTKFEWKGLEVENYLTKRVDGEKCYQVFSIHVLCHPESKTYFIYPAQVDGFFYDEKANILTPVEIKCVKQKTVTYARNLQVKYLQGALGQVTKMVFAYYNEFTDFNGVEKWTISHFEVEDVPNNGAIPTYGNDRILLLSKILEYNKNIPSILTIIENSNGDILRTHFASSNAYEEVIAIECVLGKCQHGKSNSPTQMQLLRVLKNAGRV
ncbi:hypothetical protein Ocin01_00159 [Orchesella cincta]|uniref:Uncharacterized protein n=1 Tax=Orchesella cincta TaxID=48709 RepID=A0A1D2NMR6_ORCCI|nr:hypothetical protein Ocin01_00159 [Orchesella cincta]